ncbi:MAG: hypothetical protein TREMPRED_000847, partial [Tremellales sp. Tagirdzhanova-0007]
MLNFASYCWLSFLSLLSADWRPVSSLVPSSSAIQIKSNANLSCGSTDHPIISGYFSVPQSTAQLFFSLFPSEQPGLIITFEGGPGASGFDFPFIGAGPCQLGDNGKLERAEHPWTDEASLLVLDYPVGAGWSFANDLGDVPDSAMWAAEEFDDFLQ